MADNTEYDRGTGQWFFGIYNPEATEIGPFTGRLVANKDYHVVTAKTKDGTTICVVSIPSPNIGYVINQLVKQPEDRTNVVSHS